MYNSIKTIKAVVLVFTFLFLLSACNGTDSDKQDSIKKGTYMESVFFNEATVYNSETVPDGEKQYFEISELSFKSVKTGEEFFFGISADELKERMGHDLERFEFSGSDYYIEGVTTSYYSPEKTAIFDFFNNEFLEVLLEKGFEESVDFMGLTSDSTPKDVVAVLGQPTDKFTDGPGQTTYQYEFVFENGKLRKLFSLEVSDSSKQLSIYYTENDDVPFFIFVGDNYLYY